VFTCVGWKVHVTLCDPMWYLWDGVSLRVWFYSP